MAEASRGGGTTSEEQYNEFQQQVQTYIAWVNSQLKKRSGNKPVTDLKADLKDGVVLATIVEIISGERLDEVKNPAHKLEDKRRNIRTVLKFISSKNIRMHHITENDVIEGNIKSIMRLILTLAAHFKPSSVGMKKSVSAAAANANVALGDIHKRVTSSGGFRSRWKSSTPSSIDGRKHFQSSPSSRSVSQMSNRSDADSFTIQKLSSSGVFASPKLPERKKGMHNAELFSSPIGNLSSINSEIVLSSGGGASINASEQITEYYDDIENDLSSTRDLISLLQNLLLNGELPDEDNEDDISEQCHPLEASTPNEERVILMSRLDLCQHENSRLKAELADVRQDCRATSASKTVLQSRTRQQDKELVVLKQEILKLNLLNDNLRKDKDYATAQIEEYQREKQTLSNELSEKNMMIKHLNDELSIMSAQLKRIGDDSKLKLNSMQKLENQVQELSHQLRILQRYKQSSKPIGNEATVISDSLHSLRSNIPLQDSRQHVLDTLEQAVSSLIETDHRNDSTAYHGNDISKHSVTYSPRNRRKDIAHKGASTTVIYFMERNMTPVRALIYKRIGDITLQDFKDILQQSGNYKYNFKALDPEFGTVKKEIFHDNDIVPGWEGKIVAWLEIDE